MRMSPTVNVSCATCARTADPKGWMARATRQAKRNSSRTRQRPIANSIDHDFPLIQMSCNIVIKGKAHQYDQERDSDLLPEQLGALGQRRALDCFDQLIDHLTS